MPDDDYLRLRELVARVRTTAAAVPADEPSLAALDETLRQVHVAVGHARARIALLTTAVTTPMHRYSVPARHHRGPRAGQT